MSEPTDTLAEHRLTQGLAGTCEVVSREYDFDFTFARQEL